MFFLFKFDAVSSLDFNAVQKMDLDDCLLFPSCEQKSDEKL